VKQVFATRRGILVNEVPPPRVEPGTILVRTAHSCISVGTEMSGIRSLRKPLWRRALDEPEKLVKLVQHVRSEGASKTRALLRSQLSAAHPVGYSAAGTVIAIGSDITDIAVGDRVACAGGQWAQHAEIIRVPRNMAVKLPEPVSTAAASTVALGSIALQGLRRATPEIGETFVLIGLGILGQITQRMLHANGVRVIGIDLQEARVQRALEHGMETGLTAADDAALKRVQQLTGGQGVDGVIVTAASPSSEILSQAFRMCRRKGRVVLVGDVGLDIRRADIYEKELDFRISTSYGPGRYDSSYEERGHDYPFGYVRWTEGRNMAAYLDLVASGRIAIADLVDTEFPIEQAPQAYASLNSGVTAPLSALLSYAPTVEIPQPQVTLRTVASRKDMVRLAVVGAGGFAQTTLLPIIQKHRALFTIEAIVGRQGHRSLEAAKAQSAAYATTDLQQVLDDPSIDAVLVATRHDLHASMALAALRAGKHVFVEKPLCLTRAELSEIETAFAGEGEMPLLLTGFNRRFSPAAAAMARMVTNRSNPLIVNYRVNAGYIPPTHWVHETEGGGRNIGEACHFYDFMTFLTGAKIAEVHATAIRPGTDYYRSDDNFSAILRFEDGSVGNLTYTALGSSNHPKERVEIYCDGKVAQLEDFKSLTFSGENQKDQQRKIADKGHEAEMIAFAQGIRNGSWPIPLWQQLQAMRIAFDVQDRVTA
jgi:predicted dehydrogenase/threonine dehydrogenase-like Zn-dependent dehydrogenase